MKTIKNTLGISIIFVALIFAGVQNVNAQSLPHIHVSWSAPGDCECTISGNSYYRIDAAIINECEEDFFTEWEDFAIVPVTSTSVDFYPDWYCDDHSNEPCYLVTGVIRKFCPDGHGGYIEQCSGKFNQLVSCYTLMHQTINVVVEWD